jgi:hypothetical protein
MLGTHWKAYKVGERGVESKYQAAALKAEERARQLEQELIASKQKAEERYVQQKRKADAAAAGARTELDGLRNALAERGAPGANSTSCPGAYGSDRLEQELFGQCASALTSMAAEADRLEALVVGLQGYVKGVCLTR